MTYCIAGGNSFNLVLSHVDHTDPSTWVPEGAVRDMKEHFRDWDPK
jgi:salicylate hydroxylase